MRVVTVPDGFDIVLAGQTILRHRIDHPCAFVGQGDADITMDRGNFTIEDRLVERAPLRHATVMGDEIALSTVPGQPPRLRFILTPAGLTLVSPDPATNRFWLRIVADPAEHVWGGGEQMSYLNLRGRRFPLWTSEPGVGRDPATEISWRAGVAGGTYWTTNYPQPTYLSSRHYALHVNTTAYAVFDFRAAGYHEIEVWEAPTQIELWARPTYADLVTALSERFGHPPPLPGWIYAGAIIGLKDGVNSFARLDRMIEAGVQVSGVWCEDWAGLRTTSFGARLFWDWRASEERYPALAAQIAALRARGIRFLAYVNPYLCEDGTIFPEAEAGGYFARDADGATALVDFGEFLCGVVDFTNPEASAWFVRRVLQQNMLDLGISGWMADFGEYLPTNVRLANGVDPMLMHNAWPVLWAAVNAEATRGTDALFFMRAGYSGVQAHCPLLWAGDQSVDFSRHDGLVTTICGSLSAGLLGNAYSHSDIGGYTSLFGNVRTAELVMRWAEMAAFTPVMRTHEGNRPRANLQIDEDPAVLAHFAAMTRLWVRLVPYLQGIVSEAQATGLPAQRPLFLHFEEDLECYDIQDCYLYGADLLVAPVHRAGVTQWPVYLPRGVVWVHLWSGADYAGGAVVTVDAPIGQPPVFFRAGSPYRALFESIAA